MKIGLFGYEDTCINAYDPDTHRLIGIYSNYKDAGNKLGILSSMVQKTCSRRGKAYSETFKKQVSLRLSKKMDKKELVSKILLLDHGLCPGNYRRQYAHGDHWNENALYEATESRLLEILLSAPAAA